MSIGAQNTGLGMSVRRSRVGHDTLEYAYGVSGALSIAQESPHHCAAVSECNLADSACTQAALRGRGFIRLQHRRVEYRTGENRGDGISAISTILATLAHVVPKAEEVIKGYESNTASQ